LALSIPYKSVSACTGGEHPQLFQGVGAVQKASCEPLEGPIFVGGGHGRVVVACGTAVLFSPPPQSRKQKKQIFFFSPVTLTLVTRNYIMLVYT
jgi:hypothetical protein